MPTSPNAADLPARVEDHLRRYGAETARIVEVFARRHRLSRHDVHGLVLIMNAERVGEPCTAGDLQRALTLTSGAVTGVIDRLVRAGHVRREIDTADRRRVRLRTDEPGRLLGREFFGPLARRTDPIMARRSAAELAVIERFLAETVRATAAYRDELERRPSR
jgi:DNA-binding MarR family transcriptional regulator